MQQKRTISLLGALAIGVGGMVGGGIFAVLGEAVSLAHGATAVAFSFAGIVALLSAYSYAKLSVFYQSEGGTVAFVDAAFGHNLLSGSLNLMLWLSYLVTISLYAVAFSSYGATFFQTHSKLLTHILISLAIILPALINLLSASFVSKSESFIVAIKLALLFLIIGSSSSYVSLERLSVEHWSSPFSIVVAGMIIFVAYEGFELIANAAQEVKDPKKNLPRAFYFSVIFVIILYILIAIITVGSVDEKSLLEAKDYALAIAAEPALGKLGFTLVSVAALLATLSAINATIYGNARLAYIIASEGELPSILKHEKNKIPTMGVVFTLGFSLIIANSINLDEIAIIGSASFLLIFFVVNISAFKLAKKIGASKFITFISSVFSLFSLLVLLYFTYKTDATAVVTFFAFVLISFLFESFYGRYIRGELFHRKY